MNMNVIENTGTKLVAAITKQLSGVYRLEKQDQCVMGQAFTYLQKNLREAGWRSMTEYNLETIVNGARPELGWGRGRGSRYFHGGVIKFGTLCTVVYRQPQFPLKLAEEAHAMGATILDIAVDDSFLVYMHQHRPSSYCYSVAKWSLSRCFYDTLYFSCSHDARAHFEAWRGIEGRMAGELGGRP